MLSALPDAGDVKASEALKESTSPDSAQPWKLECYFRCGPVKSFHGKHFREVSAASSCPGLTFSLQ